MYTESASVTDVTTAIPIQSEAAQPQHLRDDTLLQDSSQPVSAAATTVAAVPGQQIVPGSDDAIIGQITASSAKDLYCALLAGTHPMCQDNKMAIMMLLSIISCYTTDMSQIDRIFRHSPLVPTWWDKPLERDGRKSSMTNGSYYVQKVIYTNRIMLLTVYGWQPLAMYYPDEHTKYGRDDIGISTLFCDIFRNSILKCIEQNCWYTYDGTRWVAGSEKVMETCKAFTQALCDYYKIVAYLDEFAFPQDMGDEKKSTKNHPYIRYAESIKSRRVRETLLKDSQSVPGMSISQSDFDADGELLNCQNGTIDLRDCTLRPHSPTDHITKMANVTYVPGARSQLWEGHIITVMENDMDKAKYLQKAIGYALRGSHDLECMMMLYGQSSRNGKSVTVDAVNKMLGDYGGTANPETFAQKLNTSSSAHNDGLARLAGLRFVSVPEADGHLTLSASLIKRCTGDELISARPIYGKEFSFAPQFTLFFHTNHLPRINDRSMFDSNRVKVIPFTYHFPEAARNPHMLADLTTPENLSGILNWALEGLVLIKREGFNAPSSVLNAIEEYRQDSDRVGNFIRERMEQRSGDASTTEVFAAYKLWCESSGLRPGREQDFKREMERHGINVGRPRVNGKQVTSYLGWVLGQP